MLNNMSCPLAMKGRCKDSNIRRIAQIILRNFMPFEVFSGAIFHFLFLFYIKILQFEKKRVSLQKEK